MGNSRAGTSRTCYCRTAHPVFCNLMGKVVTSCDRYTAWTAARTQHRSDPQQMMPSALFHNIRNGFSHALSAGVTTRFKHVVPLASNSVGQQPPLSRSNGAHEAAEAAKHRVLWSRREPNMADISENSYFFSRKNVMFVRSIGCNLLVPGQVTAQFVLTPKQRKAGQRWVVCGDGVDLGGWDLTKGIKLIRAGKHWWGSTGLFPNKPVELRVVQCSGKRNADWDAVTQQNITLSVPMNPCVLRVSGIKPEVGRLLVWVARTDEVPPVIPMEVAVSMYEQP